MRRAYLVAAATAGFLAACRLFVDTDGLSGGAADGGADRSPASPDGSTPPGVPPPSPLPDAAADADAAASADADADAGPTSYCATVGDAGLFCDSFDNGDTTFGAWSLVETKNGGQVSLADAGPKSPPGFLRAQFGSGANSEAYGMLSRLFAAPRTHVTWSADVRVTANPATETLELLEIYDVAGPYWAFYISVDQTGALAITEEYTPDGGANTLSTTTNINGAVLGIAQWHRVSLSIDLSTKKFVATIDAQQVAAGNLVGSPASATMKLTAGISWSAKPDTASVIDMDNVVATD